MVVMTDLPVCGPIMPGAMTAVIPTMLLAVAVHLVRVVVANPMPMLIVVASAMAMVVVAMVPVMRPVMTVTVGPVPTFLVVVKPAYRIDHGIADSGTDQNLHRAVALIRVGGERYQQRGGETGGNQPAANGTSRKLMRVGIHGVVSKLRHYSAVQSLTGV